MLRPMRPIARQPLVEDILPVEGQPEVPAPAPGAAHKPVNWSVAQLLKDIKCDGGTGIYAKAKAANGGKDPVFKVGTSVIGSGGSTDTSTGTITLDPKQDRATAAQIATFELTNLSNKARFATIDADVLAGKLSREQYTRANEATEYQGIANATKAFASCGTTWGAAKGEKGFYDAFAKAKNFDDYYKNYLTVMDPKHMDYYRGIWDKNYKAAYETAHPPHKRP